MQASRVLAVDVAETETIKQDIAAILEGKDQGLFGLKVSSCCLEAAAGDSRYHYVQQHDRPDVATPWTLS